MSAYGQRDYNTLIGAGSPRINVLIEYFPISKFDSSFVVQNNIEEIILYESLLINDTLIYNKPALIYRFNSKGKRIHTETNSWSKNGGARRYNDDYGDSVISVQHEQYTRPDSTEVSRKFCQNYYKINDTLSRTVRLHYQFDSLVKVEDLGVFDSKAEWREQNRIKEIVNDTSLVESSDIDNILVIDRPDIVIPPSHTTFPQNPKPLITKDSLGREIEIFASRYFKIDGKSRLVPLKSVIISYYSETNILESCISYVHYNREKYKVIIEESESNNTKPQFPTCYLPECSTYQYIAESFVLGIPQRVIVSRENGVNKRIYTTSIKYR